MDKKISINNRTLERIRTHFGNEAILDQGMKFFVDKLVNEALDAREKPAPKASYIRKTLYRSEPSYKPLLCFDSSNIPDITHAKILEFSLEGKQYEKRKWKDLVHEVLILVKRRVGDFDEFAEHCSVHMIQKQKNDNGYNYIPDIGWSIQRSICQSVRANL